MKNTAIIILIVGFTSIAIGIIITVIDMLIDHQCYQLEPNDFYQSTICERYWKYEE
ncbi:MAG: hypothetical protein IKQ33_01665 [Clostridia bacterium]|nr:hypothetical protein [Clostridia bacterium]